MSAKHTITINGKLYDAVTGLPVTARTPTTHAHPTRLAGAGVDIMPAPVKTVPKRPVPSKSSAIHHVTAPSVTLKRQHLKAPVVKSAAPARKQASVDRSPMIAHFASHPQPLPKQSTRIVESSIVAPTPTRVMQKSHAPTPLKSRELKEKLIAHASSKVNTAKPVTAAVKKTKRLKRSTKKLSKPSIVAASLALVLLGGYLTYISMPGLSVSVAGSQAGVAAKYPSYSPDGYSFEGPVAYQPGRVELHFKSNGGSKGYVIEQRASSWNSTAVLDNLVEPASEGRYETISQNGVTIYTYDSHAAWTNGGVLYTINSEAPLDTDQLLQIAASM